MPAGTARSTQQALGLDAEYLARSLDAARRADLEPVAGADARRRRSTRRARFVEGRYKISPGVFVASRIDRLSFSELASLRSERARGMRRSRASRPAPAITSAATCSRRARISTTGATADRHAASAVRGAAAFLAVMTHGSAHRRLALLASALCSLPCQRAALAQAPVGVIRGRVDVYARAAAPVERRPNVNDLGMHARHDTPDLRRSVVYLESAPALAFPDPEPQRATMDQRNETFVPHVLAITVGTTVDFPNSDNMYHNVFSLRGPALRSRPLRGRPLEIGALRSPGHRPRVLRNPLAHERVHPRLQPSVFRGDRRPTADIRSAASLPAATRWSPGTKARSASRGRSSSPRMAAPSKRISPCDNGVTILGSLTNRIFLASAALAVVSIGAAVYFVSRTTTRAGRSRAAARAHRSRHARRPAVRHAGADADRHGAPRGRRPPAEGGRRYRRPADGSTARARLSGAARRRAAWC